MLQVQWAPVFSNQKSFQHFMLLPFVMPAVVSDTKRHDKEKQKAKQKQVQKGLPNAQPW